MKEKAIFYTVISYTDIWIDPEYGYVVNDEMIVSNDFQISENATAKEIVTDLQQAGFLATNDLRKISFDDYGDRIEITCKNGCPLLGLVQNI